MAASTAPDAMSFACRTWSFRSTVTASPRCSTAVFSSSAMRTSAIARTIQRHSSCDRFTAKPPPMASAEQMPRIQPFRSTTAKRQRPDEARRKLRARLEMENGDRRAVRPEPPRPPRC